MEQNLIKIEMYRPKREKFLPKKLCDNELSDVKSIVCSQFPNNAIRFQCSYCNSNYARKASLNTHVKQKHQEIIDDKEVSPQQIAPISSSTEATKPSEAFLQTISSGMI